ncbi:MAG: hypothetical protein ACJA16_002255 [Akkermansiaceae bacterium]
MFHAIDEFLFCLVEFFLDMRGYLGGIDFAGAGFLAAGVVAGLEVGDFVPGEVDVGDEVSFGDLLVVDVAEDLIEHIVASVVAKHAGVGPKGHGEFFGFGRFLGGYVLERKGRGDSGGGVGCEKVASRVHDLVD